MLQAADEEHRQSEALGSQKVDQMILLPAQVLLLRLLPQLLPPGWDEDGRGHCSCARAKHWPCTSDTLLSSAATPPCSATHNEERGRGKGMSK